MDRKRLSATLLVLTIVFGGLVGLLAVLDSDAVAAVAVVGGCIVGAGWAGYGVLFGRARE